MDKETTLIVVVSMGVGGLVLVANAIDGVTRILIQILKELEKRGL